MGYYTDLKIFRETSSGYKYTESIYRHDENVFGGVFSSDGRFLISFGADKRIIIWEVNGVKPSSLSVLSDYLGGKFTAAQLRSIDANRIEDILSSLSKTLTSERDEFETSIAYSERRERLKKEVLKYLQASIEKSYKLRLKKGFVHANLQEIIGYNADLQIYKIKFLTRYFEGLKF